MKSNFLMSCSSYFIVCIFSFFELAPIFWLCTTFLYSYHSVTTIFTFSNVFVLYKMGINSILSILLDFIPWY